MARKRHDDDELNGEGYFLVKKPNWFTGRRGSRRVFLHQVVMLELLGLTEMPRDCSVHHIDGNKTNNNSDNLAIMSTSAHIRLHRIAMEKNG